MSRYAPNYGPLQYNYSGTQNNGQIAQMKDYLSGETVTYGYDALKRLTSAGSVLISVEFTGGVDAGVYV